jgi:hypothetical protein
MQHCTLCANLMQKLASCGSRTRISVPPSDACGAVRHRDIFHGGIRNAQLICAERTLSMAARLRPICQSHAVLSAHFPWRHASGPSIWALPVLQMPHILGFAALFCESLTLPKPPGRRLALAHIDTRALDVRGFAFAFRY